MDGPKCPGDLVPKGISVTQFVSKFCWLTWVITLSTPLYTHLHVTLVLGKEVPQGKGILGDFRVGESVS